MARSHTPTRLAGPLQAPVHRTAVLALALLLAATGTPYPTYFSGAQFIHFLLGPAVVALAWPLWQRRAELRRRVQIGISNTITRRLRPAVAAMDSAPTGGPFAAPPPLPPCPDSSGA